MIRRRYARWRRPWVVPVLVAATLSAACGGSSELGDSGIVFRDFLIGMIQNTSDRTDPIQVNTFQFSISEDPNQFDELCP